jgi:hypothetical protein
MEYIFDELKQFGLNKSNCEYVYDSNKKYMLIRKKMDKIHHIQFLGRYKSGGVFYNQKHNDTIQRYETQFFESESSMLGFDAYILSDNLYEIDDYFDNKKFFNIIIIILKNLEKDDKNILEVDYENCNIRIESHNKRPKYMQGCNMYDDNDKYDMKDEFWFYF